MNLRLPHLPRIPEPWCGPIAKEMYWRVLQWRPVDSESGIPPPEAWNRIEVSVPTLCYPFQNDALTGSTPEFSPGLEYFEISFSPENPNRAPVHIEADDTDSQLRALPSGPGGACYLWAPGEWWIRCVSGGNGGAVATGRIPFQFVPVVDPMVLQAFLFSRGHIKAPTSQTFVIADGATTQILRVQDCLNGLVAFQVRTPANLTFRWRTPTGAGFLTINNLFEFSGPTLPLADAFISNALGSPQTVSAVYYH